MWTSVLVVRCKLVLWNTIICSYTYCFLDCLFHWFESLPHPSSLSPLLLFWDKHWLLLFFLSPRLTQWLMITYWYSAILRSLEQTHCARLVFLHEWQAFYSAFFVVVFCFVFNIHRSGLLTHGAGMAGATWNCSHLGASSVYTIQPCTMSLHAKPHT